MLFRDFGYAGRMLRNSPAFAVTTVVTIAMGIAATAVVFNVVNAVLLRPLPYARPDRLIIACGDMKKRDVKDFPFSNAEFFDLREQARSSFAEFSAVRTGRNIMPNADGMPEQIRFAQVTPNFLRMMGAKIQIGRGFVDKDGEPQTPPQTGAPNAQPPLPMVAILSHDYFQRRFGGNRDIIGRRLLNNGAGGPQVVGVLAPNFELLFPSDANVEQSPDLWIAARLNYDATQRKNVSLRVIGRLKDGVSLEQAQAEADAYSDYECRQDPILVTSGFHVRLEPMQSHLVAAVRPAILAVSGAVLSLWLIACANVGNLILVRNSLRERELAVRSALGANRWDLIRRILAEALLLAGLGTAVGLGLAWAGIRWLQTVAPPQLPRLDEIAMDPAVVGFAALAGLAAAALFGLVPAFRAARPDVMQVLRASSRTAGIGSSPRLRNSVVIAEVALTFVLLIGSGLMIRSFAALRQIDPGYATRNVMTFQLLGGGAPDPQGRAAFIRQVSGALKELPGIQSVTASYPFPLTGGFSPIRWGLESARSDPTKFQAVDWQAVLPGYFDTMRTPLIAGRMFTDADNGPDRKAVIIDQQLAAKAFPNESAVGKRILIRVRTPEPESVEVIGVVAHQRQASLAEPGREQVYIMDGFLNHGAVRRWAVRTEGDPSMYAAAIRGRIAGISRGLLITEMEPMDKYIEQAQAETRFSLLLLGMFALVSALLAGVGLYVVLATMVRLRTAEIGVRMAFGAAPMRVFRLIVGHGLRLSAIGIVLGLAAAAAATRTMTQMLVGVKPTDPLTFVAMVLVFLLIAAVASWLPARRAAALDPTEALRNE